MARIRQIAPELPIAVALDSHTNLSDTMVNNSSVIVGYKTYPHVDMYETGEQAGRILIQSLKGEIEPAMVWDSRPMLTHMLQQRPTEYPMNEVMQIAKAAENDSSALAATVFGGFPLADTPFTSLSSVIVFDGSRPKAENLCRNILDSAWERRADFVYRSKSLTESVTRAKTMDQYPILLIDHGDNCGAGGTQDDMTVLEEIIRQELDDVAVGTIWDPQAVEEMIQAGTGSQVTIALGGKTDSPAIGHVGRPIKISGTVRNITDGRFKITGPMYTGVSAHMGKRWSWRSIGSRLLLPKIVLNHLILAFSRVSVSNPKKKNISCSNPGIIIVLVSAPLPAVSWNALVVVWPVPITINSHLRKSNGRFIRWMIFNNRYPLYLGFVPINI